MENRLTILNRYRLLDRPESFTTAIAALVARVRTDGTPGILSYRFFVNADDKEARGIIDYDTPRAWIAHHDLAMGWPEMKALHQVAALTEVTFLGPLTDEIRDWLAGSSLTARIESGNRFASGFQR
ncbi:hypothetical protein [Paracoccus fistulariae]|uniref:ABM domain-containing protein n=1 Tax=Paracoccus fistulariae TaxID=658446 RepID=A0ABY7SQ72_9RHOB|nr:hypothetical protein [Paracoccus fistulariae]MDB6180127.1 hypothetical protein [Paracoccus fistulariae]WCR08211.1 hypothetical protein JHX87_05200 [Paracoccus fistulariae]